MLRKTQVKGSKAFFADSPYNDCWVNWEDCRPLERDEIMGLFTEMNELDLEPLKMVLKRTSEKEVGTSTFGAGVARGIIKGIATTLEASGYQHDSIIKVLKKVLPKDVNIMSVPNEYLDATR